MSVVGLGMGIAQAVGAFDPPQPTLANYGKTTSDAITAQNAVLPAIYGAQAQWNPQTAALQNEITAQNYFGGNGSEGLLALMGRAQPALNEIGSSAASGILGEYGALGPSAIAGMEAANPAEAALLNSSSSQILNRLNSGTALDPYTQNQVSQSVRASQAARGAGYSPTDAADEAYYTTQTANQRELQNLGLAEQQAGTLNTIYGAPLNQIIAGTPRANPNSYFSTYNPGSDVQTQANPYAYQMNMYNANAQTQRDIAAWQTEMQGMNSAMGSFGGMFGGGGGGGGGGMGGMMSLASMFM